MSYFSEIRFAESPSVDAFSRLRVSDSQTLLAIQCQYNDMPLIVEKGNTGTGVMPSFSTITRLIQLSATAGTGTSFIQSFDYVPFQAGKSHLIFIGALFDVAVANAVVDVGYFDLANGFFLRQNGVAGLQIVRRSSITGSVVDEVVNQASWNLDKLDGTGPSGVILDPTKVFISIIELGLGVAKMGFQIGTEIIFVHEFVNTNVLTLPFVQQLTLPIQMLLTATATGSTKNCFFKYATINAEGGFNIDFAYEFVTPEASLTAGNGTRTHVMSIRPKTTFNGITNRSRFRITNTHILVTGNNPLIVELCIGQAITGATYTNVNTNFSAFEVSTAGTLSGVPSVVFESSYVAATNQSTQAVSATTINRFPITLNRSGAVRADGTITLVATAIGGTSTMRAMMSFAEIR